MLFLVRQTSFKCFPKLCNLNNKVIKNTRLNLSSLNTIIDPSFELTADQRQLQETAYQFAINEFRPYMKEWDEKKHFPRDQVKKCADLGFGGLYIPIEDGGSGLSRLETSIVCEALSQGCVSTTAMLTIHNMAINMLAKYGKQELKDKYLPELIAFDKMASYCLTEPEAGSDAVNLKTTAVNKGDHYVVNGTKAFISGGGESDVYFVMCRTGAPGPKGISCLLIDKDSPGLSFGKNERKLGWNSQPTRAVIMENCIVPIGNLVGAEGQGFSMAMNGLNGGRINISSCSLGAAQWAMEETIQYTSDRKQFNKSIISFQNTQFILASLACDLLVSRLIVRSSAKVLDAHERPNSDDPEEAAQKEMLLNYPLPSLAAAGKFVATEKCFTIIDQCLQLFGGYGYLSDFPLQQLLRDARVHRILEGTNQIMQLIISRDFMSKK